MANNSFLTPNMLFREAKRLGVERHIPINNLCLNLSSERLEIFSGKQVRYVSVRDYDLTLSLADFSNRILDPVISSFPDWHRAFDPATYGIDTPLKA